MWYLREVLLPDGAMERRVVVYDDGVTKLELTKADLKYLTEQSISTDDGGVLIAKVRRSEV